ncbi:MAG: response regulator transcription factor [Candidatus Eremiobacteraeota bacterium]|nr:response regulator transcription factor [Candidatus Eremiobacteraeota bacterium]MCW5870938.1 response regulator transcription factor [Candidatus Eremiobacteraeota bacterium]
MLNLMVADDHPLVRSGVRATLSQSEEIKVIAEAHDFAEAVEMLRKIKPDILLLDVEMPGGKAENLILTARELQPDIKILILTSHAEAATIRALMKAKISGYLLKDEAPEHLLQAVRVLGSGATWFSHGVMEKMMHSTDAEDDLVALSPRERQILRLLAQAKDNATIADELSLAEQTVRNHVSTLYSKLGVSSRVEAIVWVRERNLFEAE